MRIEGSVFLVTGCAQAGGIGVALVNALTAQGGKVCAVDLSFAPGVHIDSPNLTQFVADLTSWDQYRAAFRHAVDKFGRIDCVCLNAGVYEPFGGFWGDNEKNGYLTVDVNVTAAIKGTRLAIDRFLLQESEGLVIITGSVAAQIPVSRTPIYCASKWAVEGFVRSLEFLQHAIGVRVVALEPGAIKTPFWNQVDIDVDAMTNTAWTPIPDLVKAWQEIMEDDGTKIHGGSAYEVTAAGRRVYPLEGPRAPSTQNGDRLMGMGDVIEDMRKQVKERKASGQAV